MIYEIAKFLIKCYYKLRFKITIIGEDRVPSSGPVMLCSNHVSDFDPPLSVLHLTVCHSLQNRNYLSCRSSASFPEPKCNSCIARKK